MMNSFRSPLVRREECFIFGLQTNLIESALVGKYGNMPVVACAAYNAQLDQLSVGPNAEASTLIT